MVDRRNARALDQRHAICDKLAFDMRAELLVFAPQHLIGFQNRHRAAEAAKGLRHFCANRPAANNQQMLGLAGQGENRLIGEIGHGFKAANIRHSGN